MPKSWKWYGNGILDRKKLGALDLQGLRKCGKQDLKSETAVNNVQLCIIWFDYKTDLHNNSKYHAL